MGSATFMSGAAHITTTTSLSAFENPHCKCIITILSSQQTMPLGMDLKFLDKQFLLYYLF
jgi:hypothetical protein